MTKNYSNLFIRWYNNVFHLDPLYYQMTRTSENSPWHRERTVGIHTDMVVSEYISAAGDGWTKDHLYGALACAFHDVGKPRASELNGEKFKPERGYYLSFGGHEQISARLWENFAASNWETLRDTFDLVPRDIFIVGWMIEYHLPWGIKKNDKLDQIALTSMYTCEPDIYANFLLADTFGRISDDEVEKRAKVKDWVNNFHLEICARQEWIQENPKDDQPRLVMPIAPSGSGKSTYRSSLESFAFYSWDDLRHELYETDDYNEAFKASCEDKQFTNKVNKRFMELIRSNVNVYVDNINVSKKRRQYFIREARRQGYHITAVLFPTDIMTLRERQHTRDDKTIPGDVVERQYMQLQYPSFGEFDRIEVSSGNFYTPR